MTATKTRKLRFSKFGLAEDPRHLFVTWKVRDRVYLANVVDAYRREYPYPAIMLKTRHFNGEDAPDVAAGFVDVIPFSWDRQVKEAA